MSNPVASRGGQRAQAGLLVAASQRSFAAGSLQAKTTCRTQREYSKKDQALASAGRGLEIGSRPHHMQTEAFNNPTEATLVLTVHYVKINIPQSIRMQVQAVFTQQTSRPDAASSRNLQKEKSTTTNSSSKAAGDQQVAITKTKCRIDSVQTVQQKDSHGQVKEVSTKKANFHNQSLQLSVKLDASIQNIQQKVSLKLLAVNNEQTKLIGILHYSFMPSLEEFKQLESALLKFQRSIDNDACICVSTRLEAAQTTSSEYGGNIFGQGIQNPQSSIHLQNSSKNQTYDTMSQIVGTSGFQQRPIRKFQKNSTDVFNVDFTKADNMGLETKEGEPEEGEQTGNTSSLQVFEALSPQDSKDATSTTSQKKRDAQKHIVDSSKKSPTGINHIQNSSAKMKLPPVIPAKSAKDRYFAGSSSGGHLNKQDSSAVAGTQLPKFSQSHSSSFLADQKAQTPDEGDEGTRAAVDA